MRPIKVFLKECTLIKFPFNKTHPLKICDTIMAKACCEITRRPQLKSWGYYSIAYYLPVLFDWFLQMLNHCFSGMSFLVDQL
jgi:hypothetical protein